MLGRLDKYVSKGVVEDPRRGKYSRSGGGDGGHVLLVVVVLLVMMLVGEQDKKRLVGSKSP
jgi:hypothetical protein